MHIQQVQLTPEVSEGLRRLAQSAGVPLKSVLLAAHLRVLSLLSGQSDVLTGLVSNGRPEDNDAERTLGLFLNTIPFRLNLPEGTWVNLMQEIFKAEQELLPFRRYPMVQMQKDLNRQPLFETAFNFTHFHVYQSLASFTNLEVSDLKYFEETDFTFLADFSLDVSSSNISLHLKGNASELYPEQMEAISGYYSRTLTAMAREPYGDHRSQRLVSDREWHQLVVEWNDTQINYPKDLCLHELFEEVVEQTPDAVAVVFEDAMLTYRELNIRANQLAHHLQSLRVEPEVLVGFCVERSLEMVVGLLGILKAGGAYLPLDPSYPKERLAFVLSDSQTPVLVTQQSLAEHWSDHEAKVVCLDRDWSAIAQAQTKNPCTQVKPDNLAYTIYTSGSTGTPKGVLVCHQNVVRLLTATQGWYNFNQQDVWTLFHSYAFDFSVWEMWGSLLFGGRLVVVPYWVSRDPEAFYQQLCTQQVSVLNQTPSAFGQLIRVEEFASTTAQLALRLVIFGGEALSIASLKPWFDRHGDDCPQLVNMYGITETTVHVSYRPLTAADVSQGTGSVIGRPIQDMQIYVLDQYMQPVPIGVAGEMYVAGDGLARGYLRRPQLTAERFILNPLSNQSGQRLYKTSDLARYLPNGEIEYLGRLDHQVKIRGFRIELGEIEAAIGKHPGVREAVVLARADAPEQKQLVAYVVPGEEKNLTVTELRQFLQQKLPEYMVPAAFILLKELPLTQNGKVDRRALPTPDATRPELVEVYVAPRTQAEQILAQIWAQVLNVQQVGIHENYFALGGDSIRSLQVQSLARAKGLHFSLQQLFQLPTIYQLVKEIESKQTSAESWEQFEPLSLISEEDRQKLSADIVDAYPLTMLQMGMLFHSEYSPDSAIYHDIFSYYLQAPFDLQVLQTAIQQLAARHPVLQTSFALSRFSEPLQLMHRQVDIPLQVEDLRHLSTHEQQQVLADWFEAEKQRPFDWSRPPLLRFQIHQRSKETFDFTVSFHHAILDGWSVASMLTELFEHYFFLLGQTTQPLPPAPISSFRDFVALEKQALQSQECKDYWLSKLRQHTMTQLPYWSDSSSRGDVRQIHLHTVPLAPEVCQQLQQLAHSAGVPLKSVLLAAHIRVLSLLSNNSDVLTGLVTNGRREEADGERVLGLFLNTVPLRMNLSDGTWIDLVQQAFQAEQELLPFRRYPMAQIQADLGGQPLFETVFNFINFHVYQGLEGFSGLEVLGGNFFEQTNITFTANFGLDVSSSQITVLLNGHATKLSAIEMELIGGYYSTTLSAMAHDALSSYQSQRLLSNQEWHQLLVEWNNTQVNYPQDKCIHQLFEAQVEQTPDAVAVVFQDQQLTYGELNHHANQLAHYLQTLGVGPEVLVGIFMKRSLEMVIGLFGILKAGGAYVPLDPTYPKERLAFMLEDAQVPVLLTQQQLLDTLPEHNASVVCLDRDWQWIAAHKQQNPTTTVQFHDLAYIIYTSGSTGKPKGVAIEHRGVVNFLSTMQQQLRCQAEDTLLSVTTISFDIAVLELFLPLVFGAKVVLVSREVATDGSKLLQQLSHSQPTFMQATPATWQMLLAAGWQGNLQMTVLSGGEALPRQLAQQLRQRGAALWNLYGPTETTIWSTTYRVDDSEQAVLIGRPIANTQLYILDRFLQPVPVGVAGELYIGGFGVARGYLNRPELTAQKFIPNPYATVSTNQHTHQTGTRLYKTGDLACYLPDGNIKFLGRIDNQVKIRGFRIELGEIEARLAQHPDVQQAVVITRDDVSAGKQLVAYVVFNQHQALSTKNLRDFLKQKLPEYMVPANFVFLDALPLTSNGKVNYRALPNPTPSHSQFELESNFVAPRTPLEEKLSCIWAEVLGLERVGIDDNFFELGGHSLLATRLISRVRDTLSIELPLRSLFNAPTVASLTKFIELNYWAVQEQKLSLTPTISDREEGEL
jgi:amino acid adenylation domain-containing protein